MTKDLHELCDTVSDAIAEANEKIRVGGGKLGAGDVDYIDKLTHSLKSIKAVLAMDDGYSGYYPNYSRAERHMRYSRTGFADKLREMMDEAPDEKTRTEIHRLIERM